MSIDFVNRAVQIPYSSGLAVQEVLANSASLFERIGRAAENMLPDASYGEVFDAIFPTTLVGRAVLLTAIGLSIASFIAHYKAQPPQSSVRKLLISSFRTPVLFFLQALVSGNSLLPVFFLDSLIQFKTAFTVLPYFKAPSSEPSQLQRVIQVAYTAVKYVVLLGLAIDVFRNSNKNMLYGLWYGVNWLPLMYVTDLRCKAMEYPKTNLENVESEFRQALGSHIATSLSLVAIVSGIGGSLLYIGGLSCISGVVHRNFYDCLDGAVSISSAVLFLRFSKEQIHDLHLLEQYSREFIQRFSVAVYRAKELSEHFNIKLSKDLFCGTYSLAFGYTVQKKHPEQKQNILKILRNFSAEEREVCFYENQPFLDEQEVKEFFKTCEIQAWDRWFFLNPEQFQQLFLPKKIAHFLNENGLQEMQDEVEALKKDLLTAIASYAHLEKEQRELKIYEEIQQEQKKLAEYSSSIYQLDYVLGRMKNPPDMAIFAEIKQYATELKKLTPQIASVKEMIKELETLIEEHTGDLTLEVPVAIGGKGCRVSDCKEMLKTLQIPHLKQPFETFSQLLVERGIKNQYDLIEKGIFVLGEDVEKFKERLIDFLLCSDQPLEPVPAPIEDPSAAFEIGRVSEKIYRCVAFPFFCALQFYAQPVWSLAGIAVSLLLKNNEAFIVYQTVLALPERVLYDIPNSEKILYIGLSALLTMSYFTRFGFVPALLFGSGLPARVYTYLKGIRGALVA
jgi:hypothetical protein